MTAAISRRKRRKLKSEINVVPYIDVMLVLLIIFMVTAPLLNLGTDIKLPDSRATALQTPQDPVVVSIYADGGYALMIEKKNQALSGDDLTTRLRAINNQHGNDLLVLVNGDRDASYQTIMTGIDLIKAAEVTKVSLMSRPEAAK